jgi:hypothetical protein
MSHTPGPWHVQFLGPQKADLIHKGTFAGISGGSGCPNHLDADDQAIWEANARLIAAAPDLLAALEAVRPYFEGEHAYDHPHCVQLRDALAKATGGAS